MCNPLIYTCTLTHFPLLIDSAVERLNKSEKREVHLSPEARQYLYQYGASHRGAFEQALASEDPKQLEALSKGLHSRLKVALRNSKKKDATGRFYNPSQDR